MDLAIILFLAYLVLRKSVKVSQDITDCGCDLNDTKLRDSERRRPNTDYLFYPDAQCADWGLHRIYKIDPATEMAWIDKAEALDFLSKPRTLVGRPSVCINLARESLVTSAAMAVDEWLSLYNDWRNWKEIKA